MKLKLFLIVGLGLLCFGCNKKPDEKPKTEPDTLTVLATNLSMPSSGVLKSEHAESPLGYGLAQLVDNNADSKFVTPQSRFQILWTGDESKPVSYYALTSAADAPENDPKTWSLHGSNDLEKWELLDAQTGQTFSERKQKKAFPLDNAQAFRYIRLQIEANHGGSSTHLAEYALRDIPNINDLMDKATGFTDNPTTPMGNHFADRHVTTDADREWLATDYYEPLASQADQAFLKAFNVILYPTGGNPSPADVNQHGIGDCSALAVFASFAYLYPDFIKAIIKDNGDKTYTVAMFDPQGLPVDVTVTAKFAADQSGTIQAVTGKDNVACWSTILEKAMMKWQYIYKVNYNIGGIGTEHAAPLFTGVGSSFAFDRGVLGNSDLARAVSVSLKQGKLVIGGFHPGGVPIAGSGTVTVTAHAYTFMYSTDPSALFAVRNPWGGNPNVYGSADGVVHIPDNSTIPPLIDLRIVDPGKALNYGKSVIEPYSPPSTALAAAKMRVSPELMQSGR